MPRRRHLLVAALLGLILAVGFPSATEPQRCPVGDCPFVAPSDVRGVASTADRLQVMWNDDPDAYAYRVQLATDASFTGPDVRTTTKQDPRRPAPLVFKNLTEGTVYYFRVSVIDRVRQQQSRWSAPSEYATKGRIRISVGTFNISNPGDEWDERAPYVARDIVKERVQVLGIQEAYRVSERRSLLRYVNAKAAHELGSPVYRMAPGPDSDQGYDNRILFDTRIFQLLGSGAKRFDYQVGDGEVDRWLAWAHLRHRASGWNILFVTTHLAPGDNYADLLQWNELVARVDNLRQAFRVPWVVVAGDFNTTKWEHPADVMLPKMYARGFGDVLGQKYRSYDTWRARAEVKDNAWLNSFNGNDRDVDHDKDKDRIGNHVDWIFASNQLKVPFFRIVARYGKGDDDKLDGVIPSDHYLMRATLAYEPTGRPQAPRTSDASVLPKSVPKSIAAPR